MTLEEQHLRDEFCRWDGSLFSRGYTAGSSGNLSARLPDGFLVTPTNSCLGYLEPGRLSMLDSQGQAYRVMLDKRNSPPHGIYEAPPRATGVVHLHWTEATALSCVEDTDPNDTIPPITPYVVMRVSRVPLLPYTHPESADVRPLMLAKAHDHGAVLLANHGPVVRGDVFVMLCFPPKNLRKRQNWCPHKTAAGSSAVGADRRRA